MKTDDLFDKILSYLFFKIRFGIMSVDGSPLIEFSAKSSVFTSLGILKVKFGFSGWIMFSS